MTNMMEATYVCREEGERSGIVSPAVFSSNSNRAVF